MDIKNANHFPLTDPVEYKPKSFISSAEILQKIWPMLTPDRQKKIENVVSKRCFSIPVVLESIYDWETSVRLCALPKAWGLLIFT